MWEAEGVIWAVASPHIWLQYLRSAPQPPRARSKAALDSLYTTCCVLQHALRAGTPVKKRPMLWSQCIRHRMHLFIAEDEYGQTVGVVTLEDALETLLGEEIMDESDSVPDMQAFAKEKHRERLEKD